MRIFRTLLFFAFIILLSVSAQAATDFGFKVGGVTVTDENCNNIQPDDLQKGTIQYDPYTNTVTFTNVQMGRYGTDERCLYNTGNIGLKVHFVGDNLLHSEKSATMRFEKNTTITTDYDAEVAIRGKSEGAIYLSNGCTLTFNKAIISLNTSGIMSESSVPLSGTGNETVKLIDSSVHLYCSKNGTISNLAALVMTNSFMYIAGADVNNYNNVQTVKNLASLTLNGYDVITSVGQSFDPSKKTFVNSSGEPVTTSIALELKVPINDSTFPDAQFRNYVAQTVDTNHDGYLTSELYRTARDLNVAEQNISNLAGIEHFIFLETLNCNSNNLSTVNLSHNTGIKQLLISNNKLTSLNLGENTMLEVLRCNFNRLTSLNLSYNKRLTEVSCFNNYIWKDAMRALINSLPAQTAAASFYAYQENDEEMNYLPSMSMTKTAHAKNWSVKQYVKQWQDLPESVPINESTFPDAAFRNYLLSQSYGSDAVLSSEEADAVTTLSVSQKQIASLSGIEWFREIKRLVCFSNQLTSLNLRYNNDLTKVECYENKITSLNVKWLPNLNTLQCHNNKLIAITLGENSNLTQLFCYRNQMKAPEMGALVDNLPNQQGKTTDFYVYDNSNISKPEGNIITPAQIEQAKAKNWIPYYYNGNSWLPYDGAADYPLKIGNTQVTASNAHAITGDDITGSVQYDPENNVLTLTNATINGKNAIHVGSALPGLTIRLIGDNTINCPSNSNMAINWGNCDRTRLTGPGSLTINNGWIWLTSGNFDDDHRLTIDSCAVTLTHGGISYEEWDESLTINHASVHLLNGYVAVGYYDLQLVDCYISKPEGGHVSGGSICAAGSNSYFEGEIEVLPAPDFIRGDVNGDGRVNVSDVATLINMILGTVPVDQARADVNEDTRVNVSDVATLINIILGVI